MLLNPIKVLTALSRVICYEDTGDSDCDLLYLFAPNLPNYICHFICSACQSYLPAWQMNDLI